MSVPKFNVRYPHAIWRRTVEAEDEEQAIKIAEEAYEEQSAAGMTELFRFEADEVD